MQMDMLMEGQRDEQTGRHTNSEQTGRQTFKPTRGWIEGQTNSQ